MNVCLRLGYTQPHVIEHLLFWTTDLIYFYMGSAFTQTYLERRDDSQSKPNRSECYCFYLNPGELSSD